MTTFLLVRHGDTDAVGKSIAGNQVGWGLNARGTGQVEHLAKRLERIPIAAVFTSPVVRAVETAEIIARPHGLVPRLREELAEIDFGEWEGKSLAELEGDPLFQRFNKYRSCSRAPGGEWMIHVRARMVIELENIRESSPDSIIALVSHGDPLRLLIAHYLGISMDLSTRFEISAGSVTVLQCSDCESRILCVNDTGELPI